MMSKKKAVAQETTLGKFTSVVKSVPELKQFHLQREEDETGISGLGIVAVGVMFPSGLCVMEWTTPIKSVGYYNSIADLEALHGHHGKTKVKWTSEA